MSVEKPSSATRANENLYRELPAVNEIADSPQLASWIEQMPRALLVNAARDVLAQCRTEIARANGQTDLSLAHLVSRVDARLRQSQAPPLIEVINATGILLHTGLGRAPLSSRAIGAIVQAAAGYTALELDLASGERGRRVDVVRQQLCKLTGAESAAVVNNNAAALVISLNALAAEKQVIVSRGELIEIGGSFRLPEVMAAGGVKLREVGTTNKTRIADYADAITDQTGALLKVHPSNYRISGFAHTPSIEQLVALGRQRNLPVIHDVGSGALFDLAELGLADEPVVRTSIDAGSDLVLFSGDKLLGGPQAGVIVGARASIQRIERNPLMRALRVDKLTLAALSATLSTLEHPQQAASELPLWMMIRAPLEELRQRAERIAAELVARAPSVRAEIVSTTAFVGGGSLPDQGLPSLAVAIRCEHVADQELARRLRTGTPPVVGRLQNGRLMVDLRAVLARQDESLLSALTVAVTE
jgi:L-seryl-tRNA(Ser) seleniumtransferase